MISRHGVKSGLSFCARSEVRDGCERSASFCTSWLDTAYHCLSPFSVALIKQSIAWVCRSSCFISAVLAAPCPTRSENRTRKDMGRARHAGAWWPYQSDLPVIVLRETRPQFASPHILELLEEMCKNVRLHQVSFPKYQVRAPPLGLVETNAGMQQL